MLICSGRRRLGNIVLYTLRLLTDSAFFAQEWYDNIMCHLWFWLSRAATHRPGKSIVIGAWKWISHPARLTWKILIVLITTRVHLIFSQARSGCTCVFIMHWRSVTKTEAEHWGYYSQVMRKTFIFFFFSAVKRGQSLCIRCFSLFWVSSKAEKVRVGVRHRREGSDGAWSSRGLWNAKMSASISNLGHEKPILRLETCFASFSSLVWIPADGWVD